MDGLVYGRIDEYRTVSPVNQTIDDHLPLSVHTGGLQLDRFVQQLDGFVEIPLTQFVDGFPSLVIGLILLLFKNEFHTIDVYLSTILPSASQIVKNYH